jgi:hypothetical protein
MENQKSFPDQRTYNEAPPPFSLALWSAMVLCRFLNAGMLAPRIEFGINLVILVASQERRSVRRMPIQIATIKPRITPFKAAGHCRTPKPRGESRLIPRFALWSAAVLHRFPNAAMLTPKIEFGIRYTSYARLHCFWLQHTNPSRACFR